MYENSGILLDINVLINHCVSPTNRAPTYDLFNILERNIGLGIITEEIRKRSEIGVKRIARNGTKKEYEECLARFNRTDTFLNTEKTSHQKIKDNEERVMKVIKNVFDKRQKDLIRPWHAPRRYKNIMDEIYSQQIANAPNKDELESKIFSVPIEHEDILFITEAVILHEEKYENMYAASLDDHIKNALVANEIKNNFGVVCARPQEIYGILKRC